ncbi:hypothetical protein B0H19DRAFT_1116688 [Mycena capillaripes]|nr:hypothetical protein B0H19DRAFT_1116688 [Mycena capillaripes]
MKRQRGLKGLAPDHSTVRMKRLIFFACHWQRGAAWKTQTSSFPWFHECRKTTVLLRPLVHAMSPSKVYWGPTDDVTDRQKFIRANHPAFISVSRFYPAYWVYVQITMAASTRGGDFDGCIPEQILTKHAVCCTGPVALKRVSRVWRRGSWPSGDSFQACPSGIVVIRDKIRLGHFAFAYLLKLCVSCHTRRGTEQDRTALQ